MERTTSADAGGVIVEPDHAVDGPPPRAPRACARVRPRALATLATLLTLTALLVTAGPAAAAPANDDWANAQLVGASSSTAGTTVGASSEANEQTSGGHDPLSSVWYRWVAPSTGTFSADLFGSGLDETLAVYTGTSLATLARPGASARSTNDDVDGSLDPQVVFAATAGTTYYLQVDAVDLANTGPFTIHVNRVSANDTFATATVLSPTNLGYLVSSSVAGSKQAGEPSHAGNAGGASVWYSWTAPSSATVTFDTLAPITTIDTLLAAYTGTTVGALTVVASSDDVGGTTRSRISFAATAGTTYRIAVDGKAGATGLAELRWYVGTRPANDDFASPTALAGATVTTTGTTTMASMEGSEVQHPGCSGPICTEGSVWYTWTAPSSGWFEADTFGGSSWDNALQVFTGATIPTLVSVASNDDSCNGAANESDLLAQTGWNATSGTTYRIRVSLFWDRDPFGPFNLNIRPAPTSNDTFASASTIPGTVFDSPCWHNFGATKQAGEPNHAGFAGGASLWYNWTAPTTGTASINTRGAEFDTQLAIYTGTAVNALTAVASNDDFYGAASRVVFAVTAGTTYRIAVDGWNGAVQTGNFRLHLNPEPSAPATRDGPTQGADITWLTSATTISANWDAVTDEPVVGYDWCVQTVQDYTCSASPVATGSTTTATTFTRAGLALTQGTTYFVCVRARTGFNVGGYGCSDGQEVDSVAPTPNPTTGTAVAGSTSQVTFTVTAASDAVSGLDAAAYSFDNGATWQVSNVLVRTGLSPNTTYSATVRVRDVAGNLSTASTLSRATLAGAPTAPTAAGGWNAVDTYSVLLGWAAPAGGAASYRVRWSSDAYASVRASPAGTGATVPSLTANSTASWKVCAVNVDGVEETACTTPVTATTPPLPPSGPSSANVTATQADFSWTPATGATSTELQLFTDAGCTAVATTDTGVASPFTRTGLGLDRSYWYRLRSFSTASAAWGGPSACTALSTANGRTAMTIALDSSTIALGTVLPGATTTGSTTITTQTWGGTGYQVAASGGLLTSGANTVPATTSGTVGSPPGAGAGAWTGTGFGITVLSGTNLEAGWAGGTRWAALTGAPQVIHATGAAFAAGATATSTTQVGYRLALPLNQPPGAYTATITYTATATP